MLESDLLRYNSEKYAIWILKRYGVPLDSDVVNEISKKLDDIDKSLKNGKEKIVFGEDKIYELANRIAESVPTEKNKSSLTNEIANIISKDLFNAHLNTISIFEKNRGNIENAKNKNKDKKVLKFLFIAIALIIVSLSIFYSNLKEYNKMPEKAKNQVAIYVSKKYSDYYVIKNELYYCISKTKGGYTVTIGGSVRKNYGNHHRTIFAKIKFNRCFKFNK